MTATAATWISAGSQRSRPAVVAVILAVALTLLAATSASPHELLLPSSFGVVPQPAYTPASVSNTVLLPSLPAAPGVGLDGLDLGVPRAALPALPALPVLPTLPAPDHVTPVLRAGGPALLLLPQTPSSGVYHLSDTHHQFPPFLENVVNRVQNLFSSYVQIDPFHTPLGTPRPPVAAPTIPVVPAALTTAPPTPPASTASTAAITTTTTTTTTAQTDGRAINLRLLAGAPGHGGHASPQGLPRDVELLGGGLGGRGGRLQQQTSSVGGGPGQPVAFASATAQVQQPDGEAQPDSYFPAAGQDKGTGAMATKGPAVGERPPPPVYRAPPKPKPGSRPRPVYGPAHQGPSRPARPARPPTRAPGEASYYRTP